MSSGPKAPDATKLSNQQTQSNIKTATAQTGLNAMNQRTPWGNQTFSQIGQWPDGTPRFESSTTLSAGQQGIFDQNQQNQQAIADVAGGATRRLGNTLGQGLDMPQYQNFGAGPNMNQQGGQMGRLNNSIAGGGNITGNIAGGGNIANGYNAGGKITGNIAGGGNIANGYGNGGAVNGNIRNAGGIQRNLGTNDFSGDRQRVEDALLGRVNKQSQQDLGSLQQRLANQGVTQGTEAYSNAMRDYNQGLSENRTSAILGAGTEQNRMQQLAMNAGNFANSAQAQQYGQNANDTNFGLQAQAQRNSQNAAAAQFGNNAQSQRYGQNANNAQFANNAQAQRNSQNAAAAGFGNNAQAQRYGQNANNAQFANSAQAQRFGQNAAQAQFGNDAQNQRYQQTLGNAAFGNQAMQQEYQNQIGSQQLNNQNQSANFNNQLTGRNQSINELMALMGGSQMQQPQFGQTPQSGISPTDVTGNAWNQYNAQQNQSNQFNNGLGSLLGTVGGWAFSDERLKEDVRDTGMKTPGGVPIKDFRYKGSPMLQRGFVAQDVAKRQPENVKKTPGGFLAVNYRKVA